MGGPSKSDGLLVCGRFAVSSSSYLSVASLRLLCSSRLISTTNLQKATINSLSQIETEPDWYDFQDADQDLQNGFGNINMPKDTYNWASMSLNTETMFLPDDRVMLMSNHVSDGKTDLTIPLYTQGTVTTVNQEEMAVRVIFFDNGTIQQRKTPPTPVSSWYRFYHVANMTTITIQRI